MEDTKWKYTTSFASTPDGKSPFTLDVDTDLTLKNERDDTESEIVSRVRTSAYPEELL